MAKLPPIQGGCPQCQYILAAGVFLVDPAIAAEVATTPTRETIIQAIPDGVVAEITETAETAVEAVASEVAILIYTGTR
jgi:hypothetical protein